MKHKTLVLFLLMCAACDSKSSGNSATTTGGTGGTVGVVGGSGGTSTTGGASTDIKVTVNGVVTPFPVAAPDTPDFANITINIYDPQALLSDPNAAALGTAALNAAGCTQGACPYSVTNVDVTGANLGLVAEVVGNSAQWMPTYTGIVTPTQVADANSSTPIVASPALLLSNNGFGAFAALTGQTPAALLANGVLVGLTYGKLSEATAQTGGLPPAIAGATATVPAAITGETIVYPNDAFSGTQAATASAGLFIAFPNTAKAVVAPWTITGPQSDTTHTWTALTAGSNPGKLLIVPFPANP